MNLRMKPLFTALGLVLILVRANAAGPQSTDLGQKSSMKTVVFIGDSLSAGYGVQEQEAFPNVIEKKLRAKGRDVQVINAGISGSVTAGCDERVRFALKQKPALIVLELGGNDALQGVPVAVIQKNLEQAIQAAQTSRVKVLLLGIKIYTSMGAAYAASVEKVFVNLKNKFHIPLMPFVLEGVALNPSLMQADKKHPNLAGHEKVADNILVYLEPLL